VNTKGVVYVGELMDGSMKNVQNLIMGYGAEKDCVEYFIAGQLFVKAENLEFFVT
jgi:hypothetical protein